MLPISENSLVYGIPRVASRTQLLRHYLLLRDQKLYRNLYKRPPLDPTVMQFNPV
jgi:hypothetical protein